MMLIKKFGAALLALAFTCGCAVAAADGGVKDDERLVKGQLSNGMKYAIYSHANPQGQVNFWLQIGAGSLQEEDDQQGIAHFVEHMMFNGTRDYPNNQVIERFESMGLKFGRDVNAYTTYDETVYQVNMATNNQKNIDEVMNIFVNWASLATFDDQEVEDERGVIIEEWRANQGLKWRNSQQRRPFLLAGTRHLNREPIGLVETVNTVPTQRLKDYYHSWYQPENMTFIISGDMAPEQAKALIEKNFSGIKNNVKVQRESYITAPVNQVRFNVISDHENAVNSFSVIYRLPRIFVRTKDDFLKQAELTLLFQLFNQRMSDLLQEGKITDALGSMASGVGVGADYLGVFFRIVAKEDNLSSAIDRLLEELARIDRYGFTQEELQRLQNTQLAHLENAVNNDSSRDAKMLAARIASASLHNTPFISPQDRYELTKWAYGQTNLEKLGQRWQALRANNDKIVEQLVTTSALEKTLTEEQLKAKEQHYAQQPLEAYQQTLQDKKLLEELPQAGEINEETALTDGISRLTLSNGAQVILYPTSFNEKTMQLIALSHKGALSYADEDYNAVKLAVKVVNASGLGSLSAAELKYWAAQNFANVNTMLKDRELVVSVSGSVDKPEALFQLLYQRFNGAKVNADTWQIFKQAQKNELVALDTQARTRFNQDVYQLRYADDRTLPISLERLDALDTQNLLELERRLFANPTDFTFIIIGNFDVPAVKELTKRYLAGLSVQSVEALPAVREFMRPAENKELIVEADKDPYAQVVAYLHQPLAEKVTEKARQELMAFNFALARDLRVEIREKSSGVYSIGSTATLNPFVNEFSYRLAFSCDPQRYQDLLSRAKEVMSERVKQGISQQELDEYKRMQLRALEMQKSNNSQVARLLLASYSTYGDLSLYTDTESYIQALTVDAVNQTGRAMFEAKNYQIEAILLPENQK